MSALPSGSWKIAMRVDVLMRAPLRGCVVAELCESDDRPCVRVREAQALALDDLVEDAVDRHPLARVRVN
jgi:hypothetical protein